MVTFIKLLGIFILGFGVAAFVRPEIIKTYMKFWKSREMLFLGTLLAITIGIIFLLAAPQCRWSRLISVFGVWSIIKGLCLFIFGRKKIIAFMDWWAKRPPAFLRGYAVFAIAIGVLLIYAA